MDFLAEVPLSSAESSREAAGVDFLLDLVESPWDAGGTDVSPWDAGGTDVKDFLSPATLEFAESSCDAGGADGKDFFSQAAFGVFRGVSFSFTGSCEVEATGFSLLEATLGEDEVMG